MTEMGAIGPFDRLYCSHALEHLTASEGRKALSEFRRVLAPEGVAVVIVPDLEDVKPTDDVLYVSDAGPITGRDMYYGLGWAVDENAYMAHRNGFDSAGLEKAVREAGFSHCHVLRDANFQIVAVARP